MTSTHKAWRGGNEIKADVGGGGLQTGRDKMAESSHKPVTFDRALQRKKARQKRHRQGGKQPELSHRLDQQAKIPLVPPKRKKMPSKETLLKDSQVLNTLGPARPASPSKEVASMLSSLRPPPSPYRTPPDLPSTIEELLEQVPECSEGPPLEEVQEEKKDNPLGWQLPPTPSNWHDTPPKKGVPYAVLFGRDPIYVYDGNHQAVPSPEPSQLRKIWSEGSHDVRLMSSFGKKNKKLCSKLTCINMRTCNFGRYTNKTMICSQIFPNFQHF